MTVNPKRFGAHQESKCGYSLSRELRATPFPRFFPHSLRLLGLQIHRPEPHRLGTGGEFGLLFLIPRLAVSFHRAHAFGLASRITPHHGRLDVGVQQHWPVVRDSQTARFTLAH